MPWSSVGKSIDRLARTSFFCVAVAFASTRSGVMWAVRSSDTSVTASAAVTCSASRPISICPVAPSSPSTPALMMPDIVGTASGPRATASTSCRRARSRSRTRTCPWTRFLSARGTSAWIDPISLSSATRTSSTPPSTSRARSGSVARHVMSGAGVKVNSGMTADLFSRSSEPFATSLRGPFFSSWKSSAKSPRLSCTSIEAFPEMAGPPVPIDAAVTVTSPTMSLSSPSVARAWARTAAIRRAPFRVSSITRSAWTTGGPSAGLSKRHSPVVCRLVHPEASSAARSMAPAAARPSVLLHVIRAGIRSVSSET